MSSLASLAGKQPGYDAANLPVDIARAVILSAVEQADSPSRHEHECVALTDALDRILACDILSPIDVPAHDNSAMDGYAVRSADLPAGQPTVLREVGVALAGRPFQGTVAAGECVRIMTGAVMPAGSDTVVIRELVQIDAGNIAIPAGQRAGTNRRRAGDDLARGSLALPAGARIGAAQWGLIASLGLAHVDVRPPLRVAVFSTGDELRDAGQGTREGAHFDSNRYSLRGMLAHLGCATTDLGIVPDEAGAIEDTLRDSAAGHDVIITSGGISEGEADLTAPMMRRLGEVLHWKLAMRPGRPFAFGRIASKSQSAWLFGLPGNPVAAMIAFIQFVRPAILSLNGQIDDALPSFAVPVTTSMRKKPGRTEFARGRLSTRGAGLQVTPDDNQGSSVLRSMATANCLIVLEHARGDVSGGETVTVQTLVRVV